MKCKKLPIKLGDLLLCVVILALSAVIFFTINDGSEASRAVISYGGEEYYYELSDDREIEICSSGHSLSVVIEDGEVYVYESTCPDKVCKASGKISSASEIIACVPAGVSIKIEGDPDEKIDWTAP
ncbi:MAG: NusG domain II-containing protein [Clostridia bacterium]|nr:NusG domain II-containing protein [Clostridia bacterium]